ncbi:HMG1/2-like protein [Rhodamnia argentea]|uniref:HMG1/2-like protein n=1 Tax=Rhodamnia argentea TaxID=178133 RepID=A0A8B8N1W0_9MYRT|nr:HMG1/2-like protein [Rhodamnia argentea]
MKPEKLTIKPRADPQPLGDIIKKKPGISSGGVPTRPGLDFRIFMKDFRESYRAEFDSAVAKAGAEAWDSMSEAEKHPYAEKALELTDFFDKAVDSYVMMSATTAVAAPTEGKLSEAATTSGPTE